MRHTVRQVAQKGNVRITAAVKSVQFQRDHVGCALLHLVFGGGLAYDPSTEMG